jgi:hypothetical protein
MTTRRLLASATVLAALLAAIGCGGDDTSGPGTTTTTAATPVIDTGDGGHYAPTLDPADFVAAVDNPYFPLKPGSRWRYEGEEEGTAQVDDVVVTTDTKVIGGITAVVVHDTVTEDGHLKEETYDWYAQDKDGNVWYLGEDTKELNRDGSVKSTEGSWEHAVDGAYGGIVMPAHPTVGDPYRQEFKPGEAEDSATVLALDEQRSVKAGAYDKVLRTKEWSALEPDVTEEKSYAPGIGEIYEESTAGEDAHSELVSFTPGS